MFNVNGREWQILFVNAGSNYLKRADGSTTIGMTDGRTGTIYLNNKLKGRMLEKVLTHELCHAICFSYGIDIDIELEEKIASWVSMYGREVVDLLDRILQAIVKAGV